MTDDELRAWVRQQGVAQASIWLEIEYSSTDGAEDVQRRLLAHWPIEDVRRILEYSRELMLEQIIPTDSLEGGSKIYGFAQRGDLYITVLTNYKGQNIACSILIGNPRVARNFYLIGYFPGNPTQIWDSVDEYVQSLKQVGREALAYIMENEKLWFLHPAFENYDIDEEHAFIETENQVAEAFGEEDKAQNHHGQQFIDFITSDDEK